MREARFVRLVGAFVVGAGLLAALAIVGLGLRQGWMVPRATLWTRLESADFVRVGDPVTLAGLTIGEIDRLVLADDLHIIAALKVERRSLPHLRKGTVARVEPPLLIGTGRIALIPPGGGMPLAPGDTIVAEEGRGLGSLALSAHVILARVDSLATDLKAISADLVSLTASIAHPDSAFRRSMRASADLLEALAAPGGIVPAGVGGVLRRADSTLGAAQETTEDVRELVQHVRVLMASADTLLSALDALATAASEAAPQLSTELLPLLRELRLTLEQSRSSWLLGGGAPRDQGSARMGRLPP